MSNLTDLFGPPIFVYSMTDAIADGSLVQIGQKASGLFSWPVLMTKAAWQDAVAWTEADGDRTSATEQCQEGRLWDVLWLAHSKVVSTPSADCAGRLSFSLQRVPRDLQSAAAPVPTWCHLDLVVAVHDDGSPVILISCPDED